MLLAAKRGTRVLLGQVRLPVKQFFPQAARVISGLVRPTPLQLRNHQINEIHVALRRDDAGQVKTVQTGFGDPRFQFICHLLSRADHGDVAATESVLV